MHIASWLSLSVALVGCGEAAAVRSPKYVDIAATTAQPAAAPTALGVESSSESKELARSNATVEPPRDLPRVVVTRAGVSVGGNNRVVATPSPPDWARGFDVSYKRSGPNDLYLVPLAAALHDKGHDVVVAIAPEIPYRIFVEVMFTLGQSDVSKIHLLVSRSDGRVASIDHEPPRSDAAQQRSLAEQAEAMEAQLASLGGAPRPAGSARPAPKAELHLTALVVKDGISLKTYGGNVAPGCRGVGAGLAIPKSGSTYDWPLLTSCVAALKAAASSSEDTVTISASADVDFQSVVSAIDALRPSFPRVQFAIGR